MIKRYANAKKVFMKLTAQKKLAKIIAITEDIVMMDNASARMDIPAVNAPSKHALQLATNRENATMDNVFVIPVIMDMTALIDNV